MKKTRFGIRRMIISFVLIGMIVLTIASALVFGNVIFSTFKSSTESTLKTESEENSKLINEWYEKQEGYMRTMVHSMEFMNILDANGIMDYLNSNMAINEDALMYYVCFEFDKSVNPADHSHLDLDPTERSWWKSAVEAGPGNIISTEPYVDAASGKVVVSFATEFQIQGNRAVLLADIDLKTLTSLIEDMNMDEETSAYLVSKEGNVIAHYDTTYMPTAEKNVNVSDFSNINLSETETVEIADLDGAKKYVNSSVVSGNGWNVIVEKKSSVIQNHLVYSILNGFIINILVTLLMLILLSLIINRLLKPIKPTTEAIVALSEGQLDELQVKGVKVGEVKLLHDATEQLTAMFSRIIGETNQTLSKMASGDMSVADMKQYPGVFNDISNSVNEIKHNLSSLLQEVQESTSGVELGAGQLALATGELSRGATEQAGSILSLENDMNNIVERIGRSSDNCTVVSKKIAELNQLVNDGDNDMKNLLSDVENLERLSSDIQKIVGAIDNIAFQTNILALNASVEAARAGEHGRGFSVVAEEVGSLAAKCSDESKKTSELIEQCIDSIRKAKLNADSTMSVLENIVVNSNDIETAFQTIASDTQEEASSSANIQKEISSISDVVQSNTATSEETAAATEELLGQANVLKDMVNQFTIDK